MSEEFEALTQQIPIKKDKNGRIIEKGKKQQHKNKDEIYKYNK